MRFLGGLDGCDGCVCLQVYTVLHGFVEQAEHELVWPDVGCSICEATLGSFDARYLLFFARLDQGPLTLSVQKQVTKRKML